MERNAVGGEPGKAKHDEENHLNSETEIFNLVILGRFSGLLAPPWKMYCLTFCLAIILHALSYILALWMPMPQKMANASNRLTSVSLNFCSRSWRETRDVQ